jgi:hypothetical protein
VSVESTEQVRERRAQEKQLQRGLTKIYQRYCPPDQGRVPPPKGKVQDRHVTVETEDKLIRQAMSVPHKIVEAGVDLHSPQAMLMAQRLVENSDTRPNPLVEHHRHVDHLEDREQAVRGYTQRVKVRDHQTMCTLLSQRQFLLRECNDLRSKAIRKGLSVDASSSTVLDI